MRILSLDLLAFGPFTDRRVDLSARPEALTIVFGANEAGKSTSLRALEGLLFGIESTQDAHRHAPASLRVGGTLLTQGGQELRVVRRRGKKGTLRDEHDRPLPEDVLAPILRGVDRELFRSLYGLDQRRLNAGARALMDERGALGASLFDAGSSGRGVAKLLERLRSEAEEIFVPAGRTRPLNSALKQLAEARRQARSLATEHGSYEKELAELVTIASERDQAEEELRRLEREQRRLERCVKAAPLVQERKRLRAQRAALGPVVLLPEGASAERERASSDRAQALSLLEGLEAQRAEQAAALRDEQGAALALDPEEAFRTLTERAAACGNEQRRRELELERDLCERRLGELGEPAPALTSEVEVQLRSAIEAREKCALSCERERAKVAELSAELAARAARRPAGLERSAVHERLGLAVSAAERVAVREPDRLELARRVADLDVAAARAHEAVGSTLSRAALAAEAPPAPEEVDEWLRAHAELRARHERAARRAEELAEERERVTKERGVILEAGPLVTEDQLARARERRDAEILALAAAPGTGASAALAAAREADGIADRLRADAERAASLRRVEDGLARVAAAEASAARELSEAREAEHALAEAAAARMLALGAPRLASPEGYRSFVDRVRRARDAEGELSRARAQLTLLTVEAKAAEAELRAALGGPEGALGVLLGEGRSRLAEAERALAEAQHEAGKRDELAAELARAQARLALVAESEATLAARVAQLAESHGLPAQLTWEAAREALTRRRNAAEQRERLGRAQAELAALATSEERLASYCEVVASALGVSDLPGEPIARAQLLTSALTAARDRASKRRAREGQLELLEEGIERERARLRVADALLATCLARVGAHDLGELPAAEERSAKARALDAALEPLEAQLAVLAEGRELDQLEQELAGFDASDAEEQEERLSEERARLQSERDRAISRRGSIEAGLPMWQESKAVPWTERAEQLAAHARGLALRYAKLRLAGAVLEREIDAYRQLHQGPVLRRAAELAARLTRGSIERLDVSLSDKDEPELVCVRGGREVSVDGLSEGARDQLFLALRLATIERHCEGVEPLPLVLDDVLASFDDERTSATLEVLAGLAPKLQVLLFTHHEHVVELARRSAGPVQVVTL